MIDTHCHLDIKDYEDIEEVIERMKGHILIVSGVNEESNQRVIDLCETYNNVYGVIGIHPEEVDQANIDSLKWIEDHLNHPKIVGIGEIGLDYHYTKENMERQKEFFVAQILLAKKYHKTMVIHSRDAILDTYELLKSHYQVGMKSVIHAYNSSIEMAKQFAKLGCLLGIGGVVTFKNGIKLKEVVAKIPLKYFVLETDSPYLTPEPHRGKRNEPYYVKYVAEKIAEIKQIPVEEVLQVTTNNAICQFDLPIISC